MYWEHVINFATELSAGAGVFENMLLTLPQLSAGVFRFCSFNKTKLMPSCFASYEVTENKCMMTYLKHYVFKYAINSKYVDLIGYNTSVESQMGTTAEQPSLFLFPKIILGVCISPEWLVRW